VSAMSMAKSCALFSYDCMVLASLAIILQQDLEGSAFGRKGGGACFAPQNPSALDLFRQSATSGHTNQGELK
jgi:hypothetical protein